MSGFRSSPLHANGHRPPASGLIGLPINALTCAAQGATRIQLMSLWAVVGCTASQAYAFAGNTVARFCSKAMISQKRISRRPSEPRDAIDSANRRHWHDRPLLLVWINGWNGFRLRSWFLPRSVTRIWLTTGRRHRRFIFASRFLLHDPDRGQLSQKTSDEFLHRSHPFCSAEVSRRPIICSSAQSR
jgi:hypothetical protein